MSADNGIYILKTKDQYRVIHAMAIDNLWYSPISEHDNNLIPTRLVEYYGSTRYTRKLEVAYKVAFAMANRCEILEYGVQIIKIDKTWNQIVDEAKQLAPIEIEWYTNKLKEGCNWCKYDLEKLQMVIEY